VNPTSSLRLTGGKSVVSVDDSGKLQLSITMNDADRETVQLDADIGSSVTNTFVTILRDFVSDTTGNGVVNVDEGVQALAVADSVFAELSR
jgi:predicted RNA-binding protein with RPS1 domain